MSTVDDKRKQIIGAALRRFSHFGIAKTAMSEIAEDLRLSKANLYYYFPDKFSLIEAIVYQIIEETDIAIGNALDSIPGTLDLLIRMLDIKKEYFEKYYMLVVDLHEMNINEEKWAALAKAMFEREVGTTSRIFEHGIKRNELVTFDVPATSELYVAMIRGLAMFCDHATPHTLVDREELARIIEKQKQAATIFINGIKK
ncbi:TetR family transcriptional regulator [Parapedobacter pyrenivorans]|uniref:TetR family transcriptional regulator n=1 Tax=Parapedobacter pyrenivorans TaxID=1305674 RepID=A0A917HU11_9SPHI|nr:TetR/AcrR family transcriptional regulator [Parapedobacter pyrenivorans]GGG89168.1 TetR family transcriptional regulator [Parapedobacter pyrenivorans]